MEPYQQLEHDFAKWNGLDPAGMVACSSGTAALHLAFEALRLPQGSEVIVPDFGMIACARAVTLAGLTPVFVDCNENLLMDTLITNPVCHEVSVIMAAHIYGRQSYMGDLDDDASEHNLSLIEDLAEAHGIRPYERTDAACWSFYKNKIVAGEEGGAVWFCHPDHAKLARSLRSLGFTDAHDFTHIPRGHNYRMSNAHASIILESLKNADANISELRRIEAMYDRYCPAEWKMPRRDAVWVYDVRIKGMDGGMQDGIVSVLKANGIEARHGFKPLSLQDEYAKCRFVGDGKEHRALTASREVFYLPVQPGKTTEADCKRAFELIRSVVG